MKAKLVLLAALVILFNRCSKCDNSLRSVFVNEIIGHAGKNRFFALNSITNFSWDRMYFLNSDSGMRSEQVAANICGNGGSIGSHIRRMYFLRGSEVVRYFDFKDSHPIDVWVNPCENTQIGNCDSWHSSPATARYHVRVEINQTTGHKKYVLVCQNR